MRDDENHAYIFQSTRTSLLRATEAELMAASILRDIVRDMQDFEEYEFSRAAEFLIERANKLAGGGK